MKTSKIIFISLLSTIALFTLASVVDIRLNGPHGKTVNKIVKLPNGKDIIPVAAFSTLKVINCRYIIISPQDSSSIHCSQTMQPEINFSTRNDTLVISGVGLSVPNNKKIQFVRIYYTDLLRTVIIKDSDVNLENKANLILNVENSNIRISNRQFSNPR